MARSARPWSWLRFQREPDFLFVEKILPPSNFLHRVNHNRHRIPSWLGAFLSLTLVNPFAHATAPIGATPGTFAVSPTGAATYSIPIAIPPGTNGMQPQLSLVYNSQAGNGLLGMGWSIGGLSAIHRCSSTIAIDGVKNGVNYSTSDRYCLDGERLISIGGSEYRTQHETWQKITAYGTAGSGPAYFIMKTKDGMTMEYGMTVDSRIEAQGKVDVRVWALNKVQDRNGNYFTITYQEDNANGDYRPVTISYTGNALQSLTPYNSVVFSYETRTDQIPDYLGGSVIKVTQRLKTVTANSNSSNVRTYTLSYDYGGYQGQSRFTGLVECGVDACVPSTNLTWHASTGDYIFSPFVSWGGGGGQNTYYSDVNGDGRADIIGTWSQGGEGASVHVSLSTGSGFASGTWWGSVDGCSGDRWCPYHFADVNGDGKADWLIGGSVALSTGSGFAPFVSWGGVGLSAQNFSDVNGDGRSDLIGSPTGYNSGYDVGVYVSLSNGNGFGSGLQWGTIADCVNPEGSSNCGYGLGDVNGDGRADLLKSTTVGLATQPTPDLLKTITNGFGSSITFTYKKLNDSTVHTASAGSVYPYRDIKDDTHVVSKVDTSNGIGGTVSTNYTYAGAKRHVTAEAFLGFSSITSVEPSGLTHLTTHNQTLNCTEGTVSSSESWAGGVRVKYVGNTWTPVDFGGGRCYARLAGTVEETRELNNSVVGTVSTTYSGHDAYNHPGTITVDFNDGWSKTTLNTYDNDTTNWQLGRLTYAKVTATAPNFGAEYRESAFTYDALGRIASEIIEPNRSALTLTTAYAYDGFGNRISKTLSGTGIVSRTESQTFDARGQFPVTKTNAVGHTETLAFDARYGQPTSQTGPNGLTTTFSYDGFGRKVVEIRPDGTATTINYKCWNGQAPVPPATCPAGEGYAIETLASGAGPAWVYYDIFGRPVRTARIGFDGIWVYTDTAYDALGRTVSVSQPDFSNPPQHRTTFTHDVLGRVLTETRPGNRVVTTSYNGLSTTVTNPKGQSKTTVKNSQGHIVSATDNGGTMSYAHDPFGNLRSVTNVDATVTSMTYDIRGRKTAMSDPNMGAWSYGYNVLGELTTQTDAKNQTLTMSYDKLGRMVSRTLPNSEGTSTWTFDTATKGIGKLAAVSNPTANETYTYDTLGRLGAHTTSISGVTYTVTTTYDALSRIDTVTYPETGFRLKHVYDANQFGFLREVKNDATGASLWKINAGGVDAFNRIINETYGNGLTSAREYAGGTGDLNFIKTGPSGTPTSIQNETYSFDELGNVTARGWWDGAAQRSETFGYDNLNRLTSVTGPASKTFNYAPNGNITFKTGVGTYTYPTNGVRPHAVTSTVNGTTTKNYTYDANGNRLTGNGLTFTYTTFNKPKTIKKGTSTTTLTYDAGFNRVIKSNSSGTTVYVGKLYERVTSGSTVTQRHYIYAGPNVVGQYTKTNTSTTTRYFHTDHLGSVAVITNDSGGIVQRLSYDAHGKRRKTDGTDATSITAQTTRGFTKHEHDDEVGLINMNAREYDPLLGRFVTPDTLVQFPYSSQGMNRYTYVNNNPLSFTDPTGHGLFKSIKKAVQKIASNKLVRFAAAIWVGYQIGLKAKFAYFDSTLTGAGLTEAQIAAIGNTGNIIAATTQGFTTGVLTGRDIKSGVHGGFTGGLFAGANVLTQYSNPLVQMTARSGVAGLSAELRGGSFSDTFKTSFGIESLSWSALKMREMMIAQSSVPICDAAGVCRTNPNATGISAGFRGDGFKLGGCRYPCVDPDLLGGVQGKQGYFFGTKYRAGDFRDLLVESYSGPHDFLNSFMYDANGNLSGIYQRGLGAFLGNVASYANVLTATPFVVSSVLQPILPYAYTLNNP